MFNNCLSSGMSQKAGGGRQYGFFIREKEASRIQTPIRAIRKLISDIEDALRHPKGKFHTIFINYSKAFDIRNRKKLLDKLEDITKGGNEDIKFIRNLLAHNTVQVNDGVTTSRGITQANGVLQGDPMSPLFTIATANIMKYMNTQSTVSLYTYTDDIVIRSPSKQEAQAALNGLQK
ncbi:hypothetical protein ANN_13063 [Periplaneta americana]|uniref:Reverse transcriptase domain-containing protein n=1 Tax=Periplaneta americana TaxID=6978 RepID=A0ABQ8TIS9_PERAM|nr:hypothetical protein ANN_13063 [Periplaneta americana]